MMAKRDSTIGKHHSNLRLPPLFLRPSVVRGMIADLQGIHRAVVQVPLLDVRLVDMPRGSEDPRLAKANDDDIAAKRRQLERALNALKLNDSPASMFPWPNESNPSETTEPAAAQVGRALPKSQSDLGRSERAILRQAQDERTSEEGTRARPTSTKAATKAERNQRIAAAYAAGDTVGEIAAQTGLSKARVLAIAVAAGVPPRPVGRNRLIPHLDRAAVAEAYAGGLTVRTVADQFGISPPTVRACVLAHGGTLRPVGQRSPAYQPKPAPAPEPAAPILRHAEDQRVNGPDAAAPEFKRPKPRLSQFAPPPAEPVLPALSDAAFERAAPAAKAVPDVQAMAKRLAAKRAADTKLNPARVADAFARRAADRALRQAQGERSKPVPLEPAPSREECPRCGIPGWKGCDHWLPCVDQPRQVDLPDRADRAEAQQFVPASVRGKQRFTGTSRGTAFNNRFIVSAKGGD